MADEASGSGTPSPVLRNFGRNLRFRPRRHYEPRTEEEVLRILDRHSDDEIRAVGSLHSWSGLAATDAVTVDLRHFDQVSIDRDGDEVSVVAGAGCVVREVNRELQEREGARLPAQPVITATTVGGAVATGTHGVGTPSLSHFVEEVRLAAYDAEDGGAKVYRIRSGPELRAARCSLGCMGIVLSVRIRCVPEFVVEEKVLRDQSIRQILSQAEDYPLQEFLLLPHSWTWFTFRRKKVGEANRPDPGRSWFAPLYALNDLLGIDVFFNLVIRALSALPGRAPVVRFLFRRVVPNVILRGITVRDRSRTVMSRKREIFAHEEAEIFVPEAHLEEATELIRITTEIFAGTRDGLPERWASRLEAVGVRDALEDGHGSYTHDYPFVFLRLLPDETMVSMSAGLDEPCYGFNLVTYLAPEKREPFYRYADVLVRALLGLFGARPHWGKYFPPDAADVQARYPELPAFRQICRGYDPDGVFQNDFTRRILGFDQTGASAAV